MNAHTKYFHKNNKYISLLVSDKKYCKNILRCGIKLKAYLKKYLIVN